jgi:hypothetical protein
MTPALFLVFIFSCNNESKPLNDKPDSTAAKEQLIYLFTAAYSLKWQPGESK